MKIQHKLLLVALLLSASANLGFAQSTGDNPPPGHRPPRDGAGPGHRPGPPIVAALDVNKDGIIDPTELANAPAALKALDKNGDGQLDLAELAPLPPPGGPHHPPPPHAPDSQAQGPGDNTDAPSQDQANAGSDSGQPQPPLPPPHPVPPLFAALDANHDGVIDATEIANATVALKTLDKNGDGQLTPDEYRPGRPSRPTAPAHRGPGHRPHAPQPAPSDN